MPVCTQLEAFWHAELGRQQPPLREPERQDNTEGVRAVGCRSPHAWLGDALATNFDAVVRAMSGADAPALMAEMRTVVSDWPADRRRVAEAALAFLFGDAQRQLGFPAYCERVRLLEKSDIEDNFVRDDRNAARNVARTAHGSKQQRSCTEWRST